MRAVCPPGLPFRVHSSWRQVPMLAAAWRDAPRRRRPSDPEAVADFHQTNDPLEPTNRVFYKVNDGLDTVILRPVAQAYRAVRARPVRTGIHNVLDNIGGPVPATNDTLQGKPRRAGDTAMRFLINSTAGVGGHFRRREEASAIRTTTRISP